MEKKPDDAPIDTTIGASEAATALGLSPYKTPLRWQLERKGLADRDEESEAAMLGRVLEPALRASLAEHHEVEVAHGTALEAMFAGRTSMRRTGVSIAHPGIGWMRASPDGVIAPAAMSRAFAERFKIDRDGGEHVLVELKSTGLAALPSAATGRRLARVWGEPGSDAVPTEHAAQSTHGMIVVDAALREMGAGFCNKTILRVLGPGMVLPDYVVALNAELSTWIVQGLATIVSESLIGDVPLPPTTLEDFDLLEGVINDRHPGDVKRKTTRPAIDLDETMIIADWVAAKRAREAAEKAEAAARLAVVGAVGDGYGIDIGDLGRVLYTIGAPKLTESPRKITDDVKAFAATLAAQQNPIALLLFEIIKRHTRATTTGRTLRHYPKKKEATT